MYLAQKRIETFFFKSDDQINFETVFGIYMGYLYVCTPKRLATD